MFDETDIDVSTGCVRVHDNSSCRPELFELLHYLERNTLSSPEIWTMEDRGYNNGTKLVPTYWWNEYVIEKILSGEADFRQINFRVTLFVPEYGNEVTVTYIVDMRGRNPDDLYDVLLHHYINCHEADFWPMKKEMSDVLINKGVTYEGHRLFEILNDEGVMKPLICREFRRMLRHIMFPAFREPNS